MTENRPSPLALAELLRGLAECWRELDAELFRHDAGTGRGGDPSTRVPFDVDVMDARRAIDTFADHYARVLMEESDDWTPPRGGSDALLEALAMRIGHFTGHDDAEFAWEFQTDLEQASALAQSTAKPENVGVVRLVGQMCPDEQCGGTLTVSVNRDRPRPVEAMTARCDREKSHEIGMATLIAARGYIQVAQAG